MIDLTHQKVNLLLVRFPLSHILSHGNEQASSIRLGSQARVDNAPKALAAVFCADHPFDPLHFRLCRNDLADILKHLARAFAASANRPVLHAVQFLSRIAALFKPGFTEGKDLLAIIEQQDGQRRVDGPALAAHAVVVASTNDVGPHCDATKHVNEHGRAPAAGRPGAGLVRAAARRVAQCAQDGLAED